MSILLSSLLTGGTLISHPAEPSFHIEPIARAARTPASPGGLTARLTQVSPQVAIIGKPVVVTAVVTNTGARTLLRPSMTVRLTRGPLSTRADLTRWLDQADGVTNLADVASVTLATNLSPGGTASLSVLIPAATVRSTAPYGVMPMAIDVRGRDASAVLVSSTRASVLPFFRTKEFQPLTLAFAVPLTLDPDEGLFAPPGPEREQSWEKALGSSSRLSRVLRASSGYPITWAMDPALLPEPIERAIFDASGPGLDGDASDAPAPSLPAGTSSTSPPGTSPAASAASPVPASTAPATPVPPSNPATSTRPDRQLAAGPVETQLKADTASRLVAEPDDHPLWQLPAEDPDVSAILNTPRGDSFLDELLPAVTRLPGLLGVPTTRVSWPVGLALDDAQRRRLIAGYGRTPPAAHITPLSAIDPDSGNAGDAVRRSSAGHPLLGYDESLSHVFGTLGAAPATASPTPNETPAEKVQRFVAGTALLLGQRPGVDRSALIAAPRTFDPDPAAMAALFDAVSRAPWVRITSTSSLMSQLRSTAPLPSTFPPNGQVTSPPKTPSTQSVGDSPIDEPTLRIVSEQLRALGGLRSVEVSGTGQVWAATEAALATASARWRANPGDYAAARDALVSRVRRLTEGITVVPSTVNFFADSGVLQIIVTNSRDSDVSGVRLLVDPEGRQSRLRILAQPEPLEIRRNSRITVRLPVEAVAPGVASLPTRLTTPAGTRLGDDATVRVEVRPANGWIVLVIGGAAALIFLVGLYRALRLGSPRVSPVQRDQIELG